MENINNENQHVNKRLMIYMDKTCNKLAKKIKIETLLQRIISISVILLNLTIIGLSSYAIHLGVKYIKKYPESTENNMYLTISVAVCTIFLFVMAIVMAIIKATSRTLSYKRVYRLLDYLHTLYINDESMTDEIFEYNIQQIIKIASPKAKANLKNVMFNVLSGKEDE
ncbi:hypothetical protein [Mycoplasma phocoenae]|uniref:Uncharacterized protein n=1 Tax=Mycoplasma phocoenae TaxID=754517 RepID=A0A858U725_9MOLU|nr:hypothetical protein [Mycoplasma phocoenae]QJG67247.1 hypothetical protein HGG69_02960 [Mycoplasma phocoenae]